MWSERGGREHLWEGREAPYLRRPLVQVKAKRLKFLRYSHGGHTSVTDSQTDWVCVQFQDWLEPKAVELFGLFWSFLLM